jgi:hypothetical protein
MKIKKNGEVITLTESDLNRIVKKVLSEENTVRRNTKSLRRTHLGRLSEQKNVQEKPTVTNVTTYLKETLGSGNMGVLKPDEADIITFSPKGGATPGDVAVNSGECAIYKVGGEGQYVAVGLIGKLQGNGANKNWSVENAVKGVFTFQGFPSTSGVYGYAQPIKPYSTPKFEDIPMVIAKLIETFAEGGRCQKKGACKPLVTSKKLDGFIDGMVKVFKLVGMTSNVGEDINKLRRIIIKYMS